MSSCTRLPTVAPTSPWSHPGMTLPVPSWKLNGSDRFQEASNSLPSA
jgi:hypothetical protein